MKCTAHRTVAPGVIAAGVIAPGVIAARVAACLLAPLLLLVACGREEPQATSGRPVQAPGDINDLRALGYAGVSDEELDESESGVLHYDPTRSAPGYNLFTIRPICRAVLMDAEGRVVNQWGRPAHRVWSNVQLLPGGDLLVIGQGRSQPYAGAIDEHRYLARLSWEGKTLWRLNINAHHDVEVTPEGRIAVLGFKRTLNSPLAPADTVLREDLVQLCSADGELLEERSLIAALTADGAGFELEEVTPVTKHLTPYLDLIHANSVEFMRYPELEAAHPLYAPGNVLVSVRHQDSVHVMNFETGELLWSWGRGELLGPHDATVLEGGNLLIFDNGLGREWSRIVEYDPRADEIVWQYRADPPESFYSASRGSSQRLANGNTLIAVSDHGRAFEVTPEGETVWSWVNPERDVNNKVMTVVRMKRLPLEYVEAILAAH